MRVYKKTNEIFLYNIGQGQWVSLVGLGGGEGVGGGGGVGSVYEMKQININHI